LLKETGMEIIGGHPGPDAHASFHVVGRMGKPHPAT
jgi:hypothetical protein